MLSYSFINYFSMLEIILFSKMFIFSVFLISEILSLKVYNHLKICDGKKVIFPVIPLSKGIFYSRNSMSDTVRLVSSIQHPGSAGGVYEATQHFNDIKEHLHVVKRDLESLVLRNAVSFLLSSFIITSLL